MSKSQIGLHENPLFASLSGWLRKYAILAGVAEKLFVSYRRLTGNIRKAGWQGSAQESGGGGSTNRTDVAF
ncbi:hypothetical protein [Paraprevotella xylaniphila]|uniref:hypothetical protein n=1 Tax=Paraprevotella xylaniphila TaxID=454155 RepID=UPI0023F15950|nr:hypothetical protein [Paraprevotella xylaniphila]